MNICPQCGVYISGSVHICFLNTTNTSTMGSYTASSSSWWLPPPTQEFTATIPQQLIVDADTPRLYTSEQVVALLDRIHPMLAEKDTQTGERALGYSKALYHLCVVIDELKEEIEGQRDPEPGDDDATDK